METYNSNPEPFVADLPVDFQNFVPRLTAKFNPEKLVCFACVKDLTTAEGIFTKSKNERYHLFLLLITKETSPSEKKVQSWINKKYKKNKVTILVHKADQINYELNKSFTLINTAYRIGMNLYGNESIASSDKLQSQVNEDEWQDNALGAKILGAEYHKELAENMWESAGTALENEFWIVSNFLFSEAVKQYCLALIELFLDHTPQCKDAESLLAICRSFTLEMDNIIQPHIEGDQQQQMRFIQDAQIIVHYGADITPGGDVVYQIEELLRHFRKSVLRLFDDKVKEIQAITEEFRKEKEDKNIDVTDVAVQV